jgi:5-methylcytosine-specific restriction endonuclease McrA
MTGRAWQGGSTRAWRRLRRQVLERDGYRCQIRLPPWGPGTDQRCAITADCVHHTRGRATTGDDPTYLQAACTPCNLRIGDPTRHTEPEPQPMTKW